MAFFIFLNNSENKVNSLYKIAENEDDLNNLNIRKSDYKIIEVNQETFNDVKFLKKKIINYDGNIVNLEDISISFKDIIKDGQIIVTAKTQINQYILNVKKQLNVFLESNKNHSFYNRLNNYLNQIDNLDTNNINFPLNNSLEQYFKDSGQELFNPLQIP